MIDLLLTREELAELSGFRRSAEQIKWLSRQGIQFFVARDGRPRVIREALIKSHSSIHSPRHSPRLRLPK